MSCCLDQHSAPLLAASTTTTTHLLLRLDGALEERLDASLEILDLFPLEALQLVAHQPTHVLEQQPALVDFSLRIGDVGLHLAEPILLRTAGTQQLFLRRLELCQRALGRVPRVIGFLPLAESRLDGTNEADVFVNDDAEGQRVLLRLSFVELAHSGLHVGKAFERAGEQWRQFDLGKGVEAEAKVVAAVSHGATLCDDSIRRLE